MNKIKVVQIGAGHDHSGHSIKTLKTMSDTFDLIGYVKLEGEDKVFNANETYFEGVPRLTLEQALSVEGLQAAVIETEDNYLSEYAYLALSKGLAVQMDKPGSQDKATFDKTVDFAKEKGLPLHFGYMYRYNPAIKYAEQLVKDGKLGRIYSIEAQMSCYHPDDKRAWLKKFKGGMMNFLGCHLVDLVYRIAGEPNEVIPLNAVTRSDIGAEDMGMAIFKYDGGASFIKSVGLETGGFTRRNIVICGEDGTIEIAPTEYHKEGENWLQYTDMRVGLKKGLSDGAHWGYRADVQTFGPFDRYNDMFAEFASIVRGEIENPYSYEYEKKVHELLLKACGVE